MVCGDKPILANFTDEQVLFDSRYFSLVRDRFKAIPHDRLFSRTLCCYTDVHITFGSGEVCLTHLRRTMRLTPV